MQKQSESKTGNKILFQKPGNFLYPVPAVMVSCAGPDGKNNIITIAWAGTINTNPPMVSISIRKERYSYELIKNSGEFVINLTNKKLVKAADFCGCKSGRDLDKFEACKLTKLPCAHVSAPMIAEAPVSIECKVTGIMPLGSHDMFLAEVVGIYADGKYMDKNQSFHLERAELISYSHGRYFALGKQVGSFGFSVKKQNGKNKAQK